MPTVAERLRQAREAKNLSIHQVAEVTKIKSDQLRALEKGDYDAFAATVYIRGFVRTYATLLKLDVAEVLAAVDAELAQTEKFSDVPSLTGHAISPLDRFMFQLSKLKWRVILPLVVAVAVLGAGPRLFREWRAKHSSDPLAKLGPGLYQPSPTNRGELLPLPTNALPR